MATYVFYGYSPDAVSIDPDTGNLVLDTDFSPYEDRARFEIDDGDRVADGDASNDEVGDDADQVGTVYASDGSEASSGRIYVEEVLWFETSEGDTFSVTVFEIDGAVVGYVPSEPLEPGQEYTYAGTSEAGQKTGGKDNNASKNSYSTFEKNSVACFGPGTMVATENGEIPVEWLDTSDKVLTRDHGFQPILWIGRTKIAPEYFQRFPTERPVRVPAGALGPNCPTHDLQLTGDHRIMMQSAAAELMFFSSEVLAPAKAWVDAGIATPLNPTQNYTVTHILCAAHQIIVAQGAWVETMFTGAEALRRLGPTDKTRLEKLLGADLRTQQTARPCLTRKEARLVLRASRRFERRQFLKTA